MTDRARVVDLEATPQAVAARLRHREAAGLTRRLHPRPLAGRTHPRHGAGPCAGARTRRAGGVAAQPQRDGRPFERVLEGQHGLGLHVLPSARLTAPSAAATSEHAAEQVAERPTAGTTRSEHVVDVERSALTGVAAKATAGREERTLLVVLTASFGVAEHGVRLGDRLEALLRLGVAGVGVGVVGAGQLAVGLLDIGLRRVLGDPERVVEVLLHPVSRAHVRTSSPPWVPQSLSGAGLLPTPRVRSASPSSYAVVACGPAAASSAPPS